MEAIFPPTSLTPPETRKNKSPPPQKRGLECFPKPITPPPVRLARPRPKGTHLRLRLPSTFALDRARDASNPSVSQYTCICSSQPLPQHPHLPVDYTTSKPH